MATLQQLEQQNALICIDVGLDPDEQIWRKLYATPEFTTWLDQDLPQLESASVGCELSPYEQVDAIFYDFVIGESLDDDRRFKKLHSTPDRFVFELKTIEVRIFGWFAQKDHFICAFGDLTDKIKDHNLYYGYINQTEFVRNHLELDPPKYVDSRIYDDVLSDADL